MEDTTASSVASPQQDLSEKLGEMGDGRHCCQHYCQSWLDLSENLADRRQEMGVQSKIFLKYFVTTSDLDSFLKYSRHHIMYTFFLFKALKY